MEQTIRQFQNHQEVIIKFISCGDCSFWRARISLKMPGQETRFKLSWNTVPGSILPRSWSYLGRSLLFIFHDSTGNLRDFSAILARHFFFVPRNCVTALFLLCAILVGDQMGSRDSVPALFCVSEISGLRDFSPRSNVFCGIFGPRANLGVPAVFYRRVIVDFDSRTC